MRTGGVYEMDLLAGGQRANSWQSSFSTYSPEIGHDFDPLRAARYPEGCPFRPGNHGSPPTQGYIAPYDSHARRLPAEPARPAGSGVDPHLPRGRRRVREAGADV